MTSVATPPPRHPVRARARRLRREVPRRRRIGLGRLLAWAALVVLLVVTLFPFYWMLRTALSTNTALYTNAGSLLPVEFSWGGFARVLGLSSPEQAAAEGGTTGSIDFWLYLRNTVIVATVITFGQVLFSSMAAYAFARLEWKGRDAVFFLFLTALMIRRSSCNCRTSSSSAISACSTPSPASSCRSSS